jgi:hypothetical protein
MQWLTIGIIIALVVVVLVVIVGVVWKMKKDSASGFGKRRSGAIERRWRVEDLSRALVKNRSRMAPNDSTVGDLTAGQEIAQPIIQAREGAQSDNLLPGSQAYEEAQAAVFEEDLNTTLNRNAFGDSKKPIPEPLAYDQFRYSGDYELKANDPFLSSPMTRIPINLGANPGFGLATSWVS